LEEAKHAFEQLEKEWRICPHWLCQILRCHLWWRLMLLDMKLGGWPLAFISHALSDKSKVKPMYERELMAILIAGKSSTNIC